MPKVKSLEELMVEIAKKKQEVDNRKQAYDKADKEYKELCNKKNALELKKISEAMSASDKSLDEVLKFISGNQR